MNEKLKSIIYGVAVGDALGVPYEFRSRKEMSRNSCEDMIGYGTYNQPAGSWSDDTSLTLCLLDAIDYKAEEIDFDKAKQNFMDWCFHAKFTAKNVRFDIGNTTIQAINKMKQGVDVFKCGITENTANGNGSLMRISPLIPLLEDIEDMESRFRIVEQVSSMTHRHTISVVGCHIYTEIMRLLWNGLEKQASVSIAIQKLISFYEDKNEKPYDISYKNAFYKYQRIFKDDFSSLKEKEINSEGYVVSTLEASLYCLLKSNTYEETVLRAVNLGDDTDTTAAIAGSMAGLYYGFNAIPKDWVETLLNKMLIDSIINKHN